MFLNHEQISERLRKADLIIDPSPDDMQVGAFTIDLRLGTQFRVIPSIVEDSFLDLYEPTKLTTYFEKSPTISRELGQKIILHPGSLLIATTLEYIQIPRDLVGITFSRSSLARAGLLTFSSTVDPSFQGRLTVEFSNLGSIPIALYPGMRIVRLGFVQTKAIGEYRKKYLASMTREFSKIDLDADFEKVRNLMSKRTKGLEAKRAPTMPIRDLLSKALEAEGPEKGKALERLTVEIFHTIKGLKVLDVNVRLKAEELDMVLQNNINVGFWRFAGSPIIVECKNWSDKVGAREISVLSDKLNSIGPDAKTGILIAPNGVSGDSASNAILKIREKRQRGQYIILLDRQALEEIVDGTHASVVIERKYGELLLI